MKILSLLLSLFLLTPLCQGKSVEAELILNNDGRELADLYIRSLSEDQCALDVRVRNSEEQYIGLWTSQPLPKFPKEPKTSLTAIPLIVDEADLLLVNFESDGLSTKGKIGWTYLLQQTKDGLKEIWQHQSTLPLKDTFVRAKLTTEPNFIQLDFGKNYKSSQLLPQRKRYFAFRWQMQKARFVPGSPQSEDGASVQADEVFEVSSTKDFIKALGSHRVIRVAPGDYNLTKFAHVKNPRVEWTDTYDGVELKLHNIENLTIEGTGEEPSRILVTPLYSTVLTFYDAKKITLKNLSLGHSPYKGQCAGNVLELNDCRDIVLRNVDLFGCGTEGLSLENVKNLTMERSVIRECTTGIMTLDKCQDIRFKDCQFKDCEEFDLITILGCKEVSILSSVISGNRSGYKLFNIRRSEDVIFEGLTLRDNKVAKLCNDPAYLKFLQ